MAMAACTDSTVANQYKKFRLPHQPSAASQSEADR